MCAYFVHDIPFYSEIVVGGDPHHHHRYSCFFYYDQLGKNESVYAPYLSKHSCILDIFHADYLLFLVIYQIISLAISLQL